MSCPRCQSERFTPLQPCPNCGLIPTQLDVRREQTIPFIQSANFADAQQTPFSSSIDGNERTSLHLQKGHYLLMEQQERLYWGSELYELWWVAQDMESGERVSICEVMLPPKGSTLQKFLSSATKALVASSNHAHLQPLLNVFMERGHGFFVFLSLNGESLQARIRRSGLLREQEAIDCYVQVAEALLFLSQQKPPIIHGRIQPEHIINVNAKSRWVLTKGSVLLAGGAAPFLPHEQMQQLSAYTAPEVAHGSLSPSSDLYSLTSVIYYAATGKATPSVQWGQQARRMPMEAALSPSFAAVLLRGMMPLPERFQHPSEIFQALGRDNDDVGVLNRRSGAHRNTSHQNQEHSDVFVPSTSHIVEVQSPLPKEKRAHSVEQREREERETLLPQPGKLLPYPYRLDRFVAVIWTIGIILSASILLFFAR